MSPIQTDLLPDTRRALVHRLATGQVQGRAPSVVAAVVRDSRPVCVDGWGSVDGSVPDGNIQYGSARSPRRSWECWCCACATRGDSPFPTRSPRTTLLPVAPHATGWAVHPWADVLLAEPAVDTGRMAPAGQLWSTATDLARFTAFLLDGDDRVLHPDTVMRAPTSPPEATNWDSGYGLGVQLLRRDGRLLAGHTGSMPGFVATVWVSADDGLGAVVLGNVTAGLTASALAADLLADRRRAGAADPGTVAPAALGRPAFAGPRRPVLGARPPTC